MCITLSVKKGMIFSCIYSIDHKTWSTCLYVNYIKPFYAKSMQIVTGYFIKIADIIVTVIHPMFVKVFHS